ncbi:MAG: amidohydrolase family protein [Pseudomonadales bacterium]|nr:amidohydrolase family protein [Pseudomonadales bacterium]
MHDLTIRGGLIVDGSGSDPFLADIAVDGTEIAQIGKALPVGRTDIDAKGHIVTPGFVDIHTHLDAQIGWDPMLTPVSWHGVTTAVLGNCGVTFAPCKPGDPEFLAAMMETVEDIPREAILSGLAWNWEHYGEYLDTLETLDPVINVAGLVGHCAVRYYVMGERGIAEQASDAEKQQIADIVHRAIKDGAIGFSTSRNPGHVIPDGRSVPGTYAEHDELVAIAKVVGAEDALMQSVMNMSEFEDEMALLKKEGRHARILFSHYTGGTTSFGNKVEAKVMAMREGGMDVNAMLIPRGSGLITGLACNQPWRGGPWDKLLQMELKDRLVAIQNGDLVSELVDFARENAPIIAAEQIYYLGEGDKPNYTAGPNKSLQAIARDNDEHPAETYLRISLGSGGNALFTLRSLNRSLDALAAALASDFCLPGLGDAGAHVSQIMDSGWTTFVMTHWHLDTGLFSLPEVVNQLTAAPARIIGLGDRGRLEVGMKADLNVINLDTLSERMPELVHDVPGGAPRFIQKARGYRATICNGAVVLENDQQTGARAGLVLRHGRTR